MISYAGVPLGVASPEVALWVASNIDPQECYQFGPRYLPGIGLDAMPMLPMLPPGPVQVGRLHWPQGASRFATASYVLSTEDLAAIRSQVYEGSGLVGAPLVISEDGGGLQVEADMWMLPPRPLAQIGSESGLWLLSLADDRWRWWWVASTIGTESTWADLYDAIGTALGVTITADAVASAYLNPPSDLSANYPALPILLDAVATSVGQRVTRAFDGTVRAINAATARSQWQASAATYAARLLAGGELLL